MKKLLALALVVTFSTLAIAAKTPAGVKYPAVITRVIDGDTVAVKATWLPDPLKKELSIRVFGVDTPEKGFRAKCPEEAKLGLDATDFTKSELAAAKKKEIVLYEWDKYGGRVLGDVILDGKSLREQLIAKGYAREYFGEAKLSWCK